ncbi:hypothetical protein CJF25_06505 [Photobacterium phosphoreum]|uniref:hypothetical protein n=1 Tax=Photobacterium phosphoreum TaxID=659 RepID=UPI001E62249C|nr:hypothetical protein [Photobacterium phosphoreum]MCD9462645.1 hypothetical protein [Photobacterium phosphoreum]
MILIHKDLGFDNYVAKDFEFNIRFVHSDPIEACLPDFTYVAVDVEKYDIWWQRDCFISYIPRDLEDILYNSNLFQPSLQYSKSINKTASLVQSLKSHESFDFICPVLTEHYPSLQQGRHRFWLARELKLPFVVVSANARAINQLNRLGLLYSRTLISRYVFNRELEVIQDMGSKK